MAKKKEVTNGVYEVPELTEAEKAMPLYKYYKYPLRVMGPLYRQALDHGPMDKKYTIPTDRIIDHLMMPGEYAEMHLGYCMHPEGGGFIKHYSFYPGARFDMLRWYYNWINIPTKNQPEGCGNMKYKIWVPADHFHHFFVNGKDNKDGVLTQEKLDLGVWPGTPYADQFISIRYPLNLEEFGLSKEKKQAILDAGCWIDPAVVKYFDPKDYWENGKWTRIQGSNVMVTMSRPTPGGVEKLSSEWIGWEVKDGKLVYDETTPAWKAAEEWMWMGISHATTEAQHLADFLPELYAEYHDKAIDAD
jgi:hypothetical protein